MASSSAADAAAFAAASLRLIHGDDLIDVGSCDVLYEPTTTINQSIISADVSSASKFIHLKVICDRHPSIIISSSDDDDGRWHPIFIFWPFPTHTFFVIRYHIFVLLYYVFSLQLHRNNLVSVCTPVYVCRPTCLFMCVIVYVYVSVSVYLCASLYLYDLI